MTARKQVDPREFIRTELFPRLFDVPPADWGHVMRKTLKGEKLAIEDEASVIAEARKILAFRKRITEGVMGALESAKSKPLEDGTVGDHLMGGFFLGSFTGLSYDKASRLPEHSPDKAMDPERMTDIDFILSCDGALA
ncbi:MAG: hypothetical protein V1875_04255 [Candidatus Altiarchaeota archaeon]